METDRLGDLRHLINTAHDLTDAASPCADRHGAAIDTTTAAGKLVFGIFAALAEFERELIAERTVAGLACAARGRKAGAFQMTAAKLRLRWRHGQPETKVGDLCQELASRDSVSAPVAERRTAADGRGCSGGAEPDPVAQRYG